jgi:hypothetical protein
MKLDRYLRMQGRAYDRAIDEGFSARVHDPLWFLARQWLMGEHQGENASSPVWVEAEVALTPIEPPDADPARDPTIVPAEAIVEADGDQWWTMGRRARIGRLFAGNPKVAGGVFRFAHPPPPYEALQGAPDGRAIWQARAALALADSDFGTDLPPENSSWDSRHLLYRASFPISGAELEIREHRGGQLDWYSADGTGSVGTFAQGKAMGAIPSQLAFPGAPADRFWEIEEAAVDIGGYPPDPSHFATNLLIELIYGRGDDWFLFPVNGRAGHVSTLGPLKVTDSFGEVYAGQTDVSTSPDYPGLRVPQDFGLFMSRGLDPSALLIWLVAESPLEGPVLERVQLGLDEQMNLLWAVERRVDGRELSAALPELPDGSKLAPVERLSALQGARSYRYRPATGIVQHWHPYAQDHDDADGPAYVLRGLVDLELVRPAMLPRPTARALGNTPIQSRLHRLASEAMMTGGLEVQRRWKLARGTDGRPLLWIERCCLPLREMPARTMRFDVLDETASKA